MLSYNDMLEIFVLFKPKLVFSLKIFHIRHLHATVKFAIQPQKFIFKWTLTFWMNRFTKNSKQMIT